MIDFLRRAAELADSGIPFVVVTVVETEGSTPSSVGARMLVKADGLDGGTVGGGRVEAKAVEHAQKLLADQASAETVRWKLKTDVGITCGGAMRLFFDPVGVTNWPVVIFGAGHVTQALVSVLEPLACQITCIDPRGDWLGKLPERVQRVEVPHPAEQVANLSEKTFVLCMSRGHNSDLPVLEAILKRDLVFPFLGVIGSRAKAAVLHKELVERGIPAERIQFHCPIGLPVGQNHPGEIAVSIAAQLLQYRDEHNKVGCRDS